MISLLPPIVVILAALFWAGSTFRQYRAASVEAALHRQTTSELQNLRARNADLRELQTLPQEIERLKRENALLPEAEAELQKLTTQRAALQKDLEEKKASAQQQKISELLQLNRALSDGLPEAAPAPAPAPVPGGL
jgi:DNA repair ATPase RecN